MVRLTDFARYGGGGPQPYSPFLTLAGTQAVTQTSAAGLWVSDDGLHVFYNDTVDKVIRHYALSAAWDVTSATYVGSWTIPNPPDNGPAGLALKPDGTKLFFCGNLNDRIYQCEMSTPFDLSTISYGGVYLTVSSKETIPTALGFNSDGTQLWFAGNSNKTLYRAALSTPYSLASATLQSDSLSLSAYASGVPRGIAFSDNDRRVTYTATSADNPLHIQISDVANVASAINLLRPISGAAMAGAVWKPDGKRLVTLDTTNGLRQYDVA